MSCICSLFISSEIQSTVYFEKGMFVSGLSHIKWRPLVCRLNIIVKVLHLSLSTFSWLIFGLLRAITSYLATYYIAWYDVIALNRQFIKEIIKIILVISVEKDNLYSQWAHECAVPWNHCNNIKTSWSKIWIWLSISVCPTLGQRQSDVETLLWR